MYWLASQINLRTTYLLHNYNSMVHTTIGPNRVSLWTCDDRFSNYLKINWRLTGDTLFCDTHIITLEGALSNCFCEANTNSGSICFISIHRSCLELALLSLTKSYRLQNWHGSPDIVTLVVPAYVSPCFVVLHSLGSAVHKRALNFWNSCLIYYIYHTSVEDKDNFSNMLFSDRTQI